MSITIDLPPAVVQEAREYASARGTTLEQMLFEYLQNCVARRNDADEVYEYIMGQNGWLPDDYVFDREEANAR